MYNVFKKIVSLKRYHFDGLKDDTKYSSDINASSKMICLHCVVYSRDPHRFAYEPQLLLSYFSSL